MKTTRRTFVASAGSLLVTACGGSTGGSPIAMATNPAGTNVYVVSAAIAKLLSEELGRRSTIRPYSGSSVYLPMLHRGEVALGLNTSIDSYLSYRGLPPYETPMANLRTLGMIFPLNIAFMVRGNSGMSSVEDLRGKRVVVTFRANAALEQLHRGMLATAGLDFDDIQPITIAGVPEAAAALQEDRADAIPIGIGTALGVQANAALPGGIRYLTLGTDESRLAEIMPGTRVISVQSSDTPIGVDEPIRSSSLPDMLNTGAHLSDDDAYAIISTIHNNWAALSNELPQLRSMTPADIALTDNMHPFHPGAVRFLREAGLWTEAHEANQSELLAL